MPIFHSRPSKFYGTKNNATSRGDSSCFRNFLCLVIKKWPFVSENSVLSKTKTSNRPPPQWYLYYLVFLYNKDICICLVGQIDFNVLETCLVANHEALLQCNFLVLFSSMIPKTRHNVRKDWDFLMTAYSAKVSQLFPFKFFLIIFRGGQRKSQ